MAKLIHYIIRDTRRGDIIGRYNAATSVDALNLMAEDAGFSDYGNACEIAPGPAKEIVVIAVACQHCEDTGWITVKTTYPMTYVCAGSPPDDAKGVCESRCYRCRVAASA